MSINGYSTLCTHAELDFNHQLQFSVIRIFLGVLTPLKSPGGNTPQDTNCTATCILSRKLFKLDEPDMQDTAGEAGTNS